MAFLLTALPLTRSANRFSAFYRGINDAARANMFRHYSEIAHLHGGQILVESKSNRQHDLYAGASAGQRAGSGCR